MKYPQSKLLLLLAQYGLLASALPAMSPRLQPRVFRRDCVGSVISSAVPVVSEPPSANIVPDVRSVASNTPVTSASSTSAPLPTAFTLASSSAKNRPPSTLIQSNSASRVENDAAPTAAAAVGPAEYTANPSIGGGGSSSSKDSAHFRVYGADDTAASEALALLEAAHTCFVEQVGWRSPGLSFTTAGEDGPWYKMNVYSVGTSELPGAAGVMSTDMGAGLPYLQVVGQYLTTPDVLVHEFGHAMHVSEKNWIDQGRTGAWWEPVANFIADLYIATPLCTDAKVANDLPSDISASIIELQKVVSDSFQVLVDGTPDTGNYYQSWPFLSYITNNPDNYAGMSNATLLDMIRKYTVGSNDTPLHVLANLLSDVSIQKVIGRYWARMAYVDIGHAKAREAFEAQRSTLNYANFDGGNGAYTVKAARAPRYMGANIIPLKTSAAGTVKVSITSQDLDQITATLAVKGGEGIKYVDVEKGEGSVDLVDGDEVSLVVANTPELVQYDPFQIPEEVNRGVSYEVKIEGATA